MDSKYFSLVLSPARFVRMLTTMSTGLTRATTCTPVVVSTTNSRDDVNACSNNVTINGCSVENWRLSSGLSPARSGAS